MEIIKKEFATETYFEVDGKKYLRLKDGSIAVNNLANVRINLKFFATVFHITLCKDGISINFFMVKDKIYTLNSFECLALQENIEFCDIYFNKKDVYVKYKFLEYYGVFMINSSDIQLVISHEKEYTSISYDDGYFYAKAREDLYQKISTSGVFLGESCQDFRDICESRIFFVGSEICNPFKVEDLSSKVLSINQMQYGKSTFIRVIASEGIYYYTLDLERLVGPIKNDRIENYSRSAFFVFNVSKSGDIKEVYFIESKEKTLTSKPIIVSEENIYYFTLGEKTHKRHLFSSNGTLSMFDLKQDRNLKILVQDFPVVSSHTEFLITGQYHELVLYNGDIPSFYIRYDIEKNVISDLVILKVIDEGWDEKSYICRGNDNFYVISKYNVIKVKGEKCLKRIYFVGAKNEEVYLIELLGGKIDIISKYGRSVL